MKKYSFVASRIFGTPLLIEPHKLEAILGAIGPRMGVDMPPAKIEARNAPSEAERRPYRLINGTAVIPIMGTLVSRGDWMDALSGVTSYVRLSAMLDQALADAEVRTILLEIDSHGGEAAMLQALSAKIVESRKAKPVTALVNEFAASAAYWLASAAGEVIAPQAAMVGSIGVVMTHMSVEGAAGQMGVKITHIHAGAHKIDFSPYRDLSDGAKGEGQKIVNDLYDQFTAAVARNRGIEQAAVKATEARMFSATDALRLGLITRIDSAESVFSQLRAGKSRKGVKMEITSVEGLRAAFPAFCEQLHGAGLETGRAETKAAVSAERSRITGILTHAEAKGREALALALAGVEGMTPEMAGKILGAAPKAEPGKPANSFDAMMRRIANPDIQPDADLDNESDAAVAGSWDRAIKKAGASK